MIKFLDNFFYSSATLLMILASVLAAYAFYFKLTIFQVGVLVLLNFLPFILTAALLGVIVLLLIMGLASKIGGRTVIYGLALIYLLTLISFFNFTSPVQLVMDVMQHYPDVDQYFGELIPDIIKILPNNWLAESMYWSVNNNMSRVFSHSIIQTGLTIFLFSVSFFLGHRWYLSTWLSSPKLRGQTRLFSSLKFFRFDARSYWKFQTEVILKKDFHLFFREPGQVLHLIILLILIGIFLASISGVSLIDAATIQLQSIIYLAVFLFNVLLISTLALRFVFPLISLEGETFWKIRTSPVKMHSYLRAKILPPFGVILFISQLLSFFSNRKFSFDLIIFSGILTFFITLSILLLNFGLGALFANYKEKSPIRISSSQGASLTFLFTIFYMVFLIVLLYNPVWEYFAVLAADNPLNLKSLYTAVIITGVASLVIGILSLRLGIKSIVRDL